MSDADHAPDWQGEYATIFKKMAVSHVDGNREQQVKTAAAPDDDFPRFIRRLLKKHDGRKRPALRELNDRLEAVDYYDDDEFGTVSSSTFYEWVDRYGDE